MARAGLAGGGLRPVLFQRGLIRCGVIRHPSVAFETRAISEGSHSRDLHLLAPAVFETRAISEGSHSSSRGQGKRQKV